MSQRQQAFRLLIVTAAVLAATLAAALIGSLLLRPGVAGGAGVTLGSPDPPIVPPGDPDTLIARVFETIGPSVVFLEVRTLTEVRSGSGVIVHPDGYLITNAHVVDGATEIRVSLNDDTALPGEVHGRDVRTDIAVVKVESPVPLPAASLGDSDSLRVGELVLAVGAPFGLRASGTRGIISGLHRRNLGIASYEDFIVTDAAINHGNSGGPLVDLDGRVIGINTAIVAAREGDGNGNAMFSGIGFAIPINLARRVAGQLIGNAVPGAGAAAVDPVASAAGGEARRAHPPTETAQGAIPVVHIEPATAADGSASGSGVVVGDVILTNSHVVGGADEVKVYFEDRPPVAAHVEGVDVQTDLAIVVLEDDHALPSADVGDAEGLRVGEPVIAVGRADATGPPQRRSGSVVDLHACCYGVSTDEDFIVTDAQIAAGYSGGALVNEAGLVVGILVAQYWEEGGESTALAIPIDFAQWVAGELRQRGEVLRPQMGMAVVSCRETDAAEGVAETVPELQCLIAAVDPDGPAGAAGLRAFDTIVSAKVNSKAIDNFMHWKARELPRLSGGTLLELTIERGNRQLPMQLILGEPAGPGQGAPPPPAEPGQGASRPSAEARDPGPSVSAPPPAPPRDPDTCRPER